MANDNDRDFTIARLGVTLSALEEGRDLILLALQLFRDPEDDEDGQQRTDFLDDALVCCHEAATAVQQGRERYENMSAPAKALGEAITEPE